MYCMNAKMKKIERRKEKKEKKKCETPWQSILLKNTYETQSTRKESASAQREKIERQTDRKKEKEKKREREGQREKDEAILTNH